VQGHVDDAIAKGATATVGGKRPDLPAPYDKVRGARADPRACRHCTHMLGNSLPVALLLQAARCRYASLRAGAGCTRLTGLCCQAPACCVAALVGAPTGVRPARLHLSETRACAARQGFFFQPTVLANASIDMKVFREETFGPAIPLFRFDSAAEAVKLANDTEYGLAAYFWTQARPRRARAPLAAPRPRPSGARRRALAQRERAGPRMRAVRDSCGARRPPRPAPRPAPCWAGDSAGRPPGAAGKDARLPA